MKSNLKFYSASFAALTALILLSSCGTPTQKYSASKSEGVFFTVPYSWTKISMKVLNSLEASSGVDGAVEKLALVKFQEAYSLNSSVPAKLIFSLEPPKVPVAFVRVRELFSDEANGASYNSLRNVIEPVTEWVNNPSESTPVFDILDDQVVVQKGARGVRTIFSFTVNDISQTIDQTSLISTDRSKIYVLVIRCTTVCYNKQTKLISKIADSFTVRGAR